MQVKAVLYYMLVRFHLEPNEQTQIPLKLKKAEFGVQTEKYF